MMQINHNLEALAKQLYDYWFVQFDFPDENEQPYKSSGGKMVWNETLKRDVPEGWEVKNLPFIANFKNGLACQNYRPINDAKLPVIKIDEMHHGFDSETEYVRNNVPEAIKIYNGNILFSWSASLEVMIWAGGNGALNQHIFKVTSKNDFPLYYVYYQLLEYVGVFKRMAEARKTTMGHITSDHLQQSTIVVPNERNKQTTTKFAEIINPIIQNIIKNNEQINYLMKLREQLLPLLMNGQATITQR